MNAFFALGISLILGGILGKWMGKIKMPVVAGYIVAGLVLGISGLKLVTSVRLDELSFISDFALCIIAFNIGSELEFSLLKKLGKSIFAIALSEALLTFALVTGVSWLISRDLALALILGAVSSATAPAATVMVLKEYNARGPLTQYLLAVVAIDDIICLIIYAMASSVAKVLVQHASLSLAKILLFPLLEIFLSVLVGVILGLILSALIRRARQDTETLLYLVGILLLLSGLAQLMTISTLLAAMALGTTVANLSRQKTKAIRNMERFSPPIIAAFFLLAGARLDIYLLPQIGLLGLAYLLFRLAGKLLGARLGARLSGAPQVVRKYLGLGLLSQVGIAVGLAITVAQEFPGSGLGSLVVTILLSTTIFTEIIGPFATKQAIIRAGENQ